MSTTKHKRDSGGGWSSLVGTRFRLALGLLAVPLLATALIAGVYLKSQLQYRAAVESASVDMARVMLKDAFDVLFNRAVRNVADVMNGAFAPAGSAAPDTSSVEERLVGMLAVRDSMDEGSAVPVAALLVYDPITDSLVHHGAAVTAARWRERMATAGVLDSYESPRPLITVADEDAAGPYFNYFAFLRLQGRPPVILGLDVDLERMGAQTVAPAIRAAEGAAGLSSGDSDERVGVRVAHPSGRVVYEQGRPGEGPTYELNLFGPDITSSSADRTRPFDASLSIPPGLLAELIPGGLPGSPWPLVGAAVGIAVLLTILAGLLLWRIRELVLLREQFVSSVSHELRTPLTQMLVYAETLQLDRPTPIARRRSAEVIVRETRRLIHLVENALDFVRGGRPESAFRPVTADLGETVAGILADLEALARSHRASIALETEDDVWAAVDPHMLHRIVLNLVDNALSYGPPGQTVSVAVRRTPNWAGIFVDDEGPGIPPGDRDRIWDAFDRGGSNGGTGAGLGLSIVKQLVQIQDGEVFATDAPDGGARFVVHLPLRRDPGPTPDAAPRDQPDSPTLETTWRAS